jgi:hypothetical protein
MNSVLDLLTKYNQECRHSDEINVSEYVQKSRDKQPKKTPGGGPSIVYEIIRLCDPIFDTIPSNERNHYFVSLITKICTDIDEKTCEFYGNYGFDSRVLKKSLIQSAFQEHTKNRLSSVLYLNEYYQKNFIIQAGNVYYKLCPKNYPQEIFKFERGVFTHTDTDLSKLSVGKSGDIPLKPDVRPQVYKMPLDPITKYTVEKLRELCLNSGIDLYVSGKKKLKKQLYEDLNLKLLLS